MTAPRPCQVLDPALGPDFLGQIALVHDQLTMGQGGQGLVMGHDDKSRAELFIDPA